MRTLFVRKTKKNVFGNNPVCSLDTAGERTHTVTHTVISQRTKKVSSSMCKIKLGLTQSDSLWNTSNIFPPKGKQRDSWHYNRVRDMLP